MITKICTNCEEELEAELCFSKDTYSKDGYKSLCSICAQMLAIISNRHRNDAVKITRNWKLPKAECKFCSNCKEELPATSLYFASDTSHLDGFTSRCKVCEQMYQLARYFLDRDFVLASNARWLKNNREQKREIDKRYRKDNRKILNAKAGRERAILLQACPSWSNKKQIQDIYKSCPNGYHVDHIIPLRGKEVCGLHVPNNLQYLTARENTSKNNKLLDKYRY
jgi:formate hydrogenlyase subunit 6/NADH:ubiquinone oxidoreductase subunit I